MIIKTVNRSWFNETGLRLDCTPYVTGAIEAKQKLKDLELNCDHLSDLTVGYNGGIYNGPVFKRNYVNDPQYGVKFLTSASMLLARIGNVSLLRKKDAYSKKLAYLELKTGISMISCSGTIGRMVYTRETMDGVWSCQDMLKVVPDRSKVDSGYVYAFLSSKFGVPLITSSTYGAIIPHIEPKHIASLPIPRLDSQLEEDIHKKIEQAAINQSESELIHTQVGELINSEFNFPEKLALSHRVFNHSSASSRLLQKRLDATYHDSIAQLSDQLVAGTGAKQTLADLDVLALERNRMKQIFASDEYGVPFYTSGEIFRADVTPERYLLKKIVKKDPYWKTKKDDILIARSGQVGGIIGTGVWADYRFTDTCVSPHVLRLRVQNDSVDAGYLYAFLCCTDVGYRQLIRGAAGSSVPFLSVDDILSIKLPRLTPDKEKEIGEMVRKAGNLAAEAQILEKKAIIMVEDAIEAATPKH